jgi:hypothetical protein
MRRRCGRGGSIDARQAEGRCEGSPRDVTDAGGVERWAAALTGIAASIAAEDSPEAVAQAFAGGAVQQRELSANDAITRARYFTRIGGASAP